ncbi:hypothetical protein AB0L88_17505 [Saccharopolyspora shandongensis]
MAREVRAVVAQLWKHADSARNGEISADVPAHGTVLVRAAPQQ